MEERERMAKQPRNATRARTPAAPPAPVADAIPPHPPTTDIAEHAGHPTRPAGLLDPRDGQTRARLMRRVPGGAYDIPETEVVRAIRAWDAVGEVQVVRDLCELLVERCMPEFQRRSWGLRHRPDLMQDAIGGMIEQLLREVRDPSEQFMLLNFIHYLHCLCADNFSQVLRQEGLSYRRDEQGRPAGRPQHIPRALMERIDVPVEETEEGGPGRDIAATGDQLGDRLAALEAQRILAYLSDPLDRQIMVLRVFEQMHWEDIAKVCGKTERTMRLRYEKSRARLRDALAAEEQMVGV
ncbi:MAG TPA: sigma-70 region 4 domain-containing protein [Ktedonobacterales bacterium]